MLDHIFCSSNITFPDKPESLNVVFQVVNVSRLLKYTKLEAEGISTAVHPPPCWPSRGAITFDKVTLSYGDNEHQALNQVSFRVHPGETVT